jgi:hypothetical protein
MSSDAFELWKSNFTAFGKADMVQRFAGLEESLFALIDEGIPQAGTRVLDHGITGGLLLLKYTTLCFRFIFGIKHAEPKTDIERTVKKNIANAMNNWNNYHSAHWWSTVVWATGAVALHNIQQNPHWPGWVKKLDLSEDPLTYLGVLVDLLQEWDRHSSDRAGAVAQKKTGISSADVWLGTDERRRVYIRYGCRDNSASERQSKLEEELDGSLVDWRDIAKVEFLNI